MKAMIVCAPAGLDRLAMEERPDPGEIRVALHGISLNFHDLGVVTGRMGGPDPEHGRVPLADGAGLVEGVGAGVTEFAPGDSVVSRFFPQRQDGTAQVGDFAGTPGDGIDGFAQQAVVLPAVSRWRSWPTPSPMRKAPAISARSAWRGEGLISLC